ncbi:ribokinase [Agromyces seonyuensis]|uniref:Ribokinase n=1 Tax=Agromyces seonyuensis TaxID=2662446 RepID=A0A6I4NZD3_9MICO|nr:ribokinase [Agromyces seonyuensis]MWB99521.1 ribokinase [Agromyces seonyuensis]
MGARVLVVGSVNVDTTHYVERLPGPGETVLARRTLVALGGKGANQAVAATRFGAEVRFVGAVGADASGRFALDELHRLGVGVDEVRLVDGVVTGAAAITVDAAAENTIVVAPGANATVGLDDVKTLDLGVGAVLAQGELAAEVVDAVVARAAAASLRVVLNLAPVIGVAPTTLALADPLVVNESEARAVGIAEDAADVDAWLAAAAASVGRLARSVVVTLGRSGAVLAEVDATGTLRATHRPAFDAVAVDTTGAGDCFAGTLAAALAEGLGLDEAVRFAAAAGACAVESPGTVGSYAERAVVLARAAAAAAD